MKLEKFEQGILKTGFVLENKISEVLKKQGWSVISGKYYEDDFDGKAREIDSIAYKTSKVKHFDVYTCLIVSCKKSESSVWALLTRELNHKDPNLDLKPLHSWSNEASIQYQLSQLNTAHQYYADMLKLGVKSALADPEVEIFAFQEMNAESGAPQNQKAIYDSIISLIKAQAYEITALPERKKAPSVYQFNLLSVVEADIVRLNFKGDKIESKLTTSEHHLSRYILNKKQSFSKVRFIKAAVFDEVLKEYTSLHTANLKWYAKTWELFYEGVEKDENKIEIYLNVFGDEVRSKLHLRIYRLLQKSCNLDDINIYWDKTNKSLAIYFASTDFDENVAIELNGDPESERVVAEALAKVYKYRGPFHFIDNFF